MSNRVKKTKPKAPHFKTVERDHLLKAIFGSASVMRKPCSACKAHNRVCEASPDDSSACLECVRRHESFCDAQGVSPQQLQRIASQHDKAESELEQAEALAEAANAKVRRLRKQKRMWLEKMSRAIARGIDDIEELERVEAEEAAAAAAASAPPPPHSDSLDSFLLG